MGCQLTSIKRLCFLPFPKEHSLCFSYNDEDAFYSILLHFVSSPDLAFFSKTRGSLKVASGPFTLGPFVIILMVIIIIIE